MQLLTFAHKNEAAAFFHFHQYKQIADVNDLYSDGCNYLLITGEGLWDSLTKTMMTLHYFDKQSLKVQCILNLGIAGSLRLGHKKFETYQIRTCYALLNVEKPEFHSYSTNNILTTQNLPLLDCLSSHYRTITTADKVPLAPFANIIDRELWSIAKAATCFNIPWNSIKVISDEISEENKCDLIQEQAHEYSKILYHTWKNSFTQKETATSQDDFPFLNVLLPTLQNYQIHLTFSQRHQVQDLIRRLLLQENISIETLLEEVPFSMWESKRPKDNSQSFIQWLKLRLTPQLGKFATNISKWLKIWQNPNIQFQMSTTDDFEALEVKFKSYNTKDWHVFLEHLQKIPRDELENILAGKV